MQAASLRLTAAADNVANVDSDGALPAAQGNPAAAAKQPYLPVQVQQTSAGAGAGTTASLTNASPAFTVRYNPSAPYANSLGQVAAPNVDVLGEILNIATARSAFALNAKTADALNRMVKQLFELDN
jgi:flagellar basal-body rod protein FlgC